MPDALKLTAIALAVLGLAACGGGGTTTGTGGPNPPGAANRTPPGTYARANAGAEDPRDLWNDPGGLRAALGLSPEADATISPLDRDSDDSTIGTRMLLDRVAPEDIKLLGARNGITYGQWKGGPAGTLNIEFDWRFAPDVDPQSRALMERAGKIWSRRLTDDFGTRIVRAGTVFQYEDQGVQKTLEGDETTDGILIFVIDRGPTSDNFSYAGARMIDIETDFEPWLGSILLNSRHRHQRGVMVHEIGHVLGIGSYKGFRTIDQYIDTDNHAFTGPAAMRANGGRPVPYQWVNADNHPVPPGAPGATVDYGHPGVCTSIMAYCRDRNVVTDPSALDFAMLDDIGYDLLDKATAAQPELYGYGAWGSHAAWGAGIERVLNAGTDRLRAAVHAFGADSATSLADNQALTGSAIWNGSLLGVDIRDDALPPVFGGAQLEIALDTLEGSARFNNLKTGRRDGATVPFRSPSLEYEGIVAGNTFSDGQQRVSAGFFGPEHDEMAGVVNDPAVGLLAGFGGVRH